MRVRSVGDCDTTASTSPCHRCVHHDPSVRGSVSREEWRALFRLLLVVDLEDEEVARFDEHLLLGERLAVVGKADGLVVDLVLAVVVARDPAPRSSPPAPGGRALASRWRWHRPRSASRTHVRLKRTTVPSAFS